MYMLLTAPEIERYNEERYNEAEVQWGRGAMGQRCSETEAQRDGATVT
jgi:hypothetical protein